MSLFRVRDFWSFDLSKFKPEVGGQRRSEEKIEEDEPEQADGSRFVVSLGQFHSIGRHQVFVCADLSGLLSIIQVPDGEQQPQKEASGSEQIRSQRTADSSGSSIDSRLGDRQLLCATNLGFPIVDLKCGFFSSALKQSIAVLSFDKLIIYQVKSRPLDLLSAPMATDFGFAADECLFSHQLEEHHRIELGAGHEFAASLLVLDNHAAGSWTLESGSNEQQKQPEGSKEGNRRHKSKSSHIHLPQRDSILVQYTNQFLFSLVEHKKLSGHFIIKPPTFEADNNNKVKLGPSNNRVDQLAQFMGPQPVAFVRDPRASSMSSSLVVAQSDNRIYCVKVNKLLALSKQNVMRRVAQSLLHHHNHEASSPNKQTELEASRLSHLAASNEASKLRDNNNDNGMNALHSALSYDNDHQNQGFLAKIELDLEATSEWQLELSSSPIQINPIARTDSSTTSGGSSKTTQLEASGQLLVMSRYQLDLLSAANGEHLWSQRFESPLLCLFTYLLPPNKNKSDHNKTQGSRLLSLVCTDCLSGDRCNLTVLEEDRVAWSALLNTKPIQLWRATLSKTSGVIAALDINQAQLSLSYLGTNSQDSCPQDEPAKEAEQSSYLEQLDLIDEMQDDGHSSDHLASSEKITAPRLKLDVRLEASDQWPQVQVEARASIRPEADSLDVIQNLSVTLEHDDLLIFELNTKIPFSTISNNCVQLQLGDCWPDGREPISFDGRFRLRPQNLSSNQRDSQFGQSMPKSLQVKLYLKFNVIHCSTIFQEESFMLPLNMVAKLVHIDYSSGLNQSFDDVLANLQEYKRQPLRDCALEDPVTGDDKSPYYLCDMFIRTESNTIELVDGIVESDLVCRGLNSEASNLERSVGSGSRACRNLSTMENINLLAQSLDCRLKYQANIIKENSMVRQMSEEQTSPVVISIAFEMQNGAQIMKGLSSGPQELTGNATVWLHLCDLSSSNISSIPEQVIRMHLKEWKSFEADGSKTNDLNPQDNPILLSIESDFPMPVIFLQDHLTKRLKSSVSSMNLLTEKAHDRIDINYQEIYNLDNFVVISYNLHDSLKSTLTNFATDLKAKFERLKDELNKEYYKFYISTMTSLSLSKRLVNLPETMHSQYRDLSALIKQYQLNLIRLFSEMDSLKRLDYQYSKIPEASELVVEFQEKLYLNWPNFLQIID